MIFEALTSWSPLLTYSLPDPPDVANIVIRMLKGLSVIDAVKKGAVNYNVLSLG